MQAKKLGCYIGVHKWTKVHTEDGEAHEECAYCGKDRPALSGKATIGGPRP
jgi:hypothetical protein